MSAGIEQFAEELLREVREVAVDSCQFLTEGGVSGPGGNRWDKLLTNDQLQALARSLIPDIVDLTLFALLDAVDTERLSLFWRGEGAEEVQDLLDVGGSDMAGSFVYPKGWRSVYASSEWNEI